MVPDVTSILRSLGSLKFHLFFWKGMLSKCHVPYWHLPWRLGKHLYEGCSGCFAKPYFRLVVIFAQYQSWLDFPISVKLACFHFFLISVIHWYKHSTDFTTSLCLWIEMSYWFPVLIFAVLKIAWLFASQFFSFQTSLRI